MSLNACKGLITNFQSQSHLYLFVEYFVKLGIFQNFYWHIFFLSRASVLYFILNDLHKINPIYQFSLKAFSVVFNVAIERAEMADDVKTRVGFLTECITYNVFMYTTRGLFECDKLIFTAQMAFQILIMKKEVNPVELDFLLRFMSYFSLFIIILWDISGFFSGPVNV